MSASFLDHFGTLEDPREERNQRHALLDIVLLTVCALVNGAEGREAVAMESEARARSPRWA